MSFAVIGVSHKNCPVEIREKVTFTQSKRLESLAYLKGQGIKEIVILSTCNRSEIYIEDNEIKEAKEKVISFYKAYFKQNGGNGDLSAYLFDEENEGAIRHLFRVAVGLDSIVLGEDQILGQVKAAYEEANTQKTSGKITHKIFQEAIGLAKKIKSEMKISEYPLSISHIAIQFLKEKQGTLQGKSALIIGIGQMNKLTTQYLLEEKLEHIYITNHTHKRALEFKQTIKDVQVIDYKKRYEFLKEVDFVISATASPHTILTYEKMPQLKKPLDIMDIAMPRDIDENINKIQGVQVYHIDHLKQISKTNETIRRALSQKAEFAIEERIVKLLKWLGQLNVENVVKGLEDYCQTVKTHTAKFLSKKMKSDVDKEVLETIMTEALKRCIRRPIAELMKIEEADKRSHYAQVLSELFELKQENEE